MNKLSIILVALLLSFSSCTIYYSIGETEQEFITKNRGKGLRIEEDGYARKVYKTCNQYGTDCTFFYFYDGKLTQVDKGVAQPDLIIQTK